MATAHKGMAGTGGHDKKLGIKGAGAVAALALVLGAGLTTPAAAGVWRATPSLEVAETWTDNVDLDSVEREYDFITRITPGINISGRGGRLDMFLDYKANFLIFARDDENTDLRHQLRSSLNSEVVEDWLSLDARASINQQFLERGGSISRNDDNVTDNRRTVQNYSISPSIKRPLGTFATAVARYRVGYVRVGAPENTTVIPVAEILDDTMTQQGRFELNSGRRFTRLNWQLSADYTYYDRFNGRRDSERTIFMADGGYRVNQWLRLEGMVGYEKLTDRTLSSRPSGFIWNAGATLTPGPRTTLSFRGGRRYERDNWSVRGIYRISERSSFTLYYVEEITTTYNILQDSLEEDPIFNPDLPGLDNGQGSLIDRSFRRKRLSATFAGSRKRNSFALTGFWEDRAGEGAFRGEDNYGVTGSFNRQLSRYMNFSMGGTYQHTKFTDGINRSDDFYSAQVGLNYLLSENLSGGVTYFHTNRQSSFDLRDLKENAVRVSLKATF